MREMMLDLSTATGLKLDVLNNSLADSFKMSCELAKAYGLSAKNLKPVVADTGDEGRDKLASQFSFLVANHFPNQAPATSSATTSMIDDTDSNKFAVDHELQLQFFQEITSLITDSAKLNTVLVKALEGVHVAAGFPRVLLCLLGFDRKSYSGRIAIGTDKDLMKDFLIYLSILALIFFRVSSLKVQMCLLKTVMMIAGKRFCQKNIIIKFLLMVLLWRH